MSLGHHEKGQTMRWGEPTRLPPLRRGRGLAAAALLTVGLVAAYAILGVLSLTSVAPSFLGGIPSSIGGIVKPGAVPTVTPKVQDYVASPSAPDLSALVVDLGVGAGTSEPLSNTFDLQNTAVTPVDISVGVTGALGVQAAFPDNSSTERLAAGKTTRVTVTSDPMHAGPLDGGRVVISIAGVAKPLTVPLTGAQAPLPPGAVTATPQAKGAVHVTWPASPSTGVAGYEVDRRLAGGSWQTLDASAPAGGIVDQTGPDGQTVEYRASAVTAGVQPALLSLPGAPGSAVPDATAPDLPTGVTPQDVNLANENAVPVQVDLPPTWAPTDVVSVTLTDTAGVAATGTASGGPSPAVVVVDASRLSDGPLKSVATVTDAVGNSASVDGLGATKDTQPPDSPTTVHGPEVVNGDAASSVPVTVHVADPEPNSRVHVQLAAGNQTADSSGDVMGFATTLNVDASDLPDGQLTVSAWTVDQAGNPSAPTGGDPITKDTSVPDNSASIHVAGGDQNPDGYVNAASAGAVTVIVRFPHATDAADNIVVSIGGQRVHRDGGDYRYVVGAARPDRSPRRAAAARGHGHRPGREFQHDDRQRHEGHRRARGAVLVHGA